MSGGHLQLVDGHQRERFIPLRDEPWFVDLVNSIASVAPLRHQLVAKMLVSANGRGGFYFGHVIGIGMEDLASLANEMIDRHFHRPDFWQLQAYRQYWPEKLTSERAVFQAIVREVLAHEWGHALDAEAGNQLFGILAERRADGYAGNIAEALGWDRVFGTAFFALIGCTARDGSCTHPPPEIRAADYEAGRQAVRARFAVDNPYGLDLLLAALA